MPNAKLFSAALLACATAVAVPLSAGQANAAEQHRASITVMIHGSDQFPSYGHSPTYGHDHYRHDRYRHDRHWRHDLSAAQVRHLLERYGFRRIDFFDGAGRTYGATAVDRRGRRVIVTVSARSGQILSVRSIRA